MNTVIEEFAPAGTAPGTIRVAVGDSRRLIAEALAALIAGLDGFLVTTVVSSDGGVAAILAQQPDLLVLGVGPAPGRAMALVRSLRERARPAQIVMLADALDAPLVRFVIDQRVNGLLLTDAPGQEVAGCLDQVARGHAVLPAGWQGVLATAHDERLDSLSKRQLEVLRLVVEGRSYEEIAGELFISLNTVKFHVRSIYLRLGVRNRMAAARLLSQQPPGVGVQALTPPRSR